MDPENRSLCHSGWWEEGRAVGRAQAFAAKPPGSTSRVGLEPRKPSVPELDTASQRKQAQSLKRKEEV